MKYLVLSAKPYEFTNIKTGELIKGVSVSYLNKKPSLRGEFGYPPLIINSQSLDDLKEEDFKQIPGIFDMDFEQVTGKDHKPMLLLTGMEFVAPVDFTVFF